MTQVTMEDLKASMCRWPIGDPQDKDFHFCGETRVSDESYCQDHIDQAYRASAPRSAAKK